ncbi:MAG: TraE/TraK family type IV conjugative transfer system protein [Campylobacterales bacterium]|jgi:hypothetical protein|nr:TraE/TraK family type IV conjugative transfer system protein [Campylobacterales bacterium]
MQETTEQNKQEEIKPQTDKKDTPLKVASFFDRITYSLFRNYMRPFNNVYVSKLKNLELAVKVLLIVLVFFMFFIAFLISSIIEVSSEKVVKISVPASVNSGAYVVQKDSASPSYFKIVAEGFVSKVSNYNYMDAEEKINSLLPSILPYTYSATFADIKKTVQFIVNEKVNQKFIIQSSEVKVKGSRAQVIFKGLLSRTVGSITTVDNKPYEIPIIIQIIDYTPYIESFDFNYIGVTKNTDEKEIALERQKEIEREKLEAEQRKLDRQKAYKQRMEERKKKDEF